MEDAKDFFPGGLQETGAAFFARTPRLLSLDFDGTLAEIASTPALAVMREEMRSLLWGLTMLPETKVAILGGRSVSDLRNKIGVPGLVYVGSHGLDFSPAALGWGIPALSGWIRVAQQAGQRLEPLVRRWPGALLESKGPDLSLHYRRVAPEGISGLVFESLKALEGLPVEVRPGKCVLEVHPEVAPGKAEALEKLAARYLGGMAYQAVLHIGDDRWDEDAFQLLEGLGERALGLKVGAGDTRAGYRLAGVSQVRRFLSLFL